MVVSTIFYFHPHLGKTPILINIFQMGCFNHQLVFLFKGGDFYVPAVNFPGCSRKTPGFPHLVGVASGCPRCCRLLVALPVWLSSVETVSVGCLGTIEQWNKTPGYLVDIGDYTN